MKKTIIILTLAMMSSTVFAKTAVECRNELTQNHSILSNSNRVKIHRIIRSNKSIPVKIKSTAQILKKELCVNLITTANGQTVKGVADGLVTEALALPAGMLTDELIDTFVGMLIIEN